MRLALLLVAMTLGACQCLEPVDENPDAGARGGGSGGGAGGGGVTGDGGGGGSLACRQASDCPGSLPGCDDPSPVSCRCGLNKHCASGTCTTVDVVCPPPLDAGQTCATPSQCVGTPAPGGRWCGGQTAWTCAFNHCVVECLPGRVCKAADAGCLGCDGLIECARPGACTPLTHLGIEESTCPQLIAEGAFLRATSLSSQACGYAVAAPDGGLLGTVTFLDGAWVMGQLPDLGGGCVGVNLPTGTIRYSLSCPGCVLTFRPEVFGP